MAIGNHSLPTQIMSDCTDGIMVCMSKWAYNVTDGLFWVLMLFGFCVVIALASLRFGGTKAYSFGSFV